MAWSRGHRKALIGFLKVPRAGLVKTRLAWGMGEGAALGVYERLVRRTLGVMNDLALFDPAVDLFLFFSPEGEERSVHRSFPGRHAFVPQSGAHLGERMENALADVLERGYSKAVLVGGDLADLEVGDLRKAFELVAEGLVVLGPAADGGFYLVGTSAPLAGAFSFRSWSDEGVYQRARDALASRGFRVVGLPVRRDVDRVADMPYLRAMPGFFSRLSVVVPFLGDAQPLMPLAEQLERELWPEDEIILVQGSGGRAEERLGRRIRLIHSPKGRGLQLNRGAQCAEGSFFWFLHADSRPPNHFGHHVRKLAALKDRALGCFHLGFDSPKAALAWISRWANLRTRLLRLPYGDQGIFCSREVYERAGGFRRPYLMEDVDFVRACRSLGKVLLIRDTVRSSPGRYESRGIWRASLENHRLMLLYRMGVDDRELYRRYYGRLP